MKNTKSQWGDNRPMLKYKTTFDGDNRPMLEYKTTFDKDEALHTSPHYTDKRFDQPQTIFGQECEDLGYDYSDRLWEWDYDGSKAAAKVANESGATIKTCRWYEAYLSAYFSRPIEIKHIIAGVNCSNGYPYIVFGYRDITGEELRE